MASKEIEDLYTSLTTPHIQGVCRDCGNGTLNNDLNPAFETADNPRDNDGEQLRCNCCGSTHLDIL